MNQTPPYGIEQAEKDCSGRRDGEAKKTEKQRLLWWFLCDYHKLVFLISSIKKFNCHLSLIGRKTGTKEDKEMELIWII
jgi:hypothetical protein